MDRSSVPDVVVRRLPRYYRKLTELAEKGFVKVSSSTLGELMGSTASQIRQDFNWFGAAGQQGYGYPIAQIRERIADILGLHRDRHMVIVGAGNLGQALMRYAGFAREGYTVRALFDVSENVVGNVVEGAVVEHIDTLEAYCAAHPVDIGIVATPGLVAQQTAERMAASGVKAIWNFAPVDVSCAAAQVENVRLSDSLYVLSYYLMAAQAKGE